ncbi:MAG: carotenoid 1,2-hydratase [Myxococcaceae bacterium]|nr:carotenoid 1,2-hydratase [Myxococcaceae bacterium]
MTMTGSDEGLRLQFDAPVPADGYRWWYVDAISDDGREALTCIAFIGSVFSPYYAWSGRKDPFNHVAINLALYRTGAASRWALTERGRGDLSRSPTRLQVGPSHVEVRGDSLEIHVRERGFPMPLGLKGMIRVMPEVRGGAPHLLNEAGAHHWWPIAPKSRVEVVFDDPAMKWSGTGYLDSNWGDGALERDFQSWTWSRAPLSKGACVLYDVQPRGGSASAMALHFDGQRVERFEPPPRVKLPGSLFLIGRETRSEAQARVVRTLTDSHFYARSIVESTLRGEKVWGVHESLELDRFKTGWAKVLLPFRMPRNAGKSGASPALQSGV